jgi:hypothetical protein
MTIDNMQHQDNVAPLNGRVELQFIVGNFTVDLARGIDHRHALAIRVESIDLLKLPCTCNIRFPCPTCLANDASVRAREARQGVMK